MQREYELRVDNCERCESDHEGVQFKMFVLIDFARAEQTHYGFCPVTAEPLVRNLIGREIV